MQPWTAEPSADTGKSTHIMRPAPNAASAERTKVETFRLHLAQVVQASVEEGRWVLEDLACLGTAL